MRWMKRPTVTQLWDVLRRFKPIFFLCWLYAMRKYMIPITEIHCSSTIVNFIIDFMPLKCTPNVEHEHLFFFFVAKWIKNMHLRLDISYVPFRIFFFRVCETLSTRCWCVFFSRMQSAIWNVDAPFWNQLKYYTNDWAIGALFFSTFFVRGKCVFFSSYLKYQCVVYVIVSVHWPDDYRTFRTKKAQCLQYSITNCRLIWCFPVNFTALFCLVSRAPYGNCLWLFKIRYQHLCNDSMGK